MWQQLRKLTLHRDLTFTACFCRVSESSSSSCQSAAALQTLVHSSHSKSKVFTLILLLLELWKTPNIPAYDINVEFWWQKCAWIKGTSKANVCTYVCTFISMEMFAKCFQRRGKRRVWTWERAHTASGCQRAHVRVRLRVTGSIRTILHTCDPLASQPLSHTCI